MKQSCIAIAFCALVAGCDGRGSITGPGGSDTGMTVALFTLSGSIQDVDGAPIAGAFVRISTDAGLRTTTSDASGQYRFDNVQGRVAVVVSKETYGDSAALLWVGRSETLNLTLARMVTLIPGVTFQGKVQSPPCDPQGWDATALCQQIFFTPPTSGDYELLLTWDGSVELDLLIDGKLLFQTTQDPKRIQANVPLAGGVRHEIRIHSYYSPQTFELTATLRLP